MRFEVRTCNRKKDFRRDLYIPDSASNLFKLNKRLKRSQTTLEEIAATLSKQYL